MILSYYGNDGLNLDNSKSSSSSRMFYSYDHFVSEIYLRMTGLFLVKSQSIRKGYFASSRNVGFF